MLRDDISHGMWSTVLPSVRQLAIRFQVSRPTVQTALAMLERERLVERSERRRTRITGRPAVAASVSKVVFLAPWPYPRIFTSMPFLIANIQGHLQKIGHEIELQNDHQLGPAPEYPQLAARIRHGPAAAWILHLMPDTVHRWFQDRQIPAVILGTRGEDIRLPAIDIDYSASARHAAGLFFRHGHRRIGLICPQHMQGSDRAAAAGFKEAFRLSRKKEQPLLLCYDEAAGGLPVLLQRMFLKKASRPTALLIDKPMDTVTTVTWMYAHGICIPRDLSIVAHDDLEFVDRIVPSVARYTIDWPRFVDKMTKHVLRVVRYKRLEGPQVFIEPEFVPGRSIAAPPAGS